MRLLRLAALSAGTAVLVGALASAPAQAPNGNWITIKGQVKMPNAPKAKPINVTVDQKHCLMNGPLFQEDVIVNPKGHGVKNVVVWLRPDTSNRRDPFPQNMIHPALVKGKVKAQNHVVDQPCCQFIPRIVVAREGDTIEFKNSAPVNHNVNFKSDDPANTFNNNMAPNTSQKTKPLQYQSSPIPFECNIHPWMKGQVRVFDHPYFAKTDADGKFEIKNAPKGKWRIIYSHENGYHKGKEGTLGFPVDGTKGDVTLDTIELELP